MSGSRARSGPTWGIGAAVAVAPQVHPARRRRSARARALCVLAMGLLFAAILPMATTSPVGATNPTCRTEPLWPDGAELVNCSAASTTVVRSVLEGTDAYRQGLMSPADRFLANSQWLVWIDTTRSPGTMHGLWALTPSGAFAGIIDPTVGDGSFKSLIAIGAGFGSSTDPKRGYRGTHVEIWRSPGGWYYTYPSGPPEASDLPPPQPNQSVSRYSSLLVDNRNGSGTILGVNGVRASMGWTVTYTLEPDRFVVEAELAASDDLEFTGDLGGLLLLTNPACSVPGNYGDCPDAAASLSSRSLHRLVTPVADDLLWNRQIAPDTDQVRESRDGVATWELLADTAAHSLVVTPQWSVTDPQGQAYTPKAAYHYNSSATDVGGLNGFGSLDVVMEAPPGGVIALGPTRGVLRFGGVLTHRAALSMERAVTATTAEDALRAWASAGRGLFFWGYSVKSLRVSTFIRNTSGAAMSPDR